MKKNFKKIYHYLTGRFGGFLYGKPSDKMIVIGVTGTSGKSSTCYFIVQILEHAGIKTAMSTTTLFKIGKKEWLNDTKMTMLGKFALHNFLGHAYKAGSKVVVVETSSQGIEQSRHLGINYDILVFTNLYPEHIEAHGGFENYKAAKGKLFAHLAKCKKKKIDGKEIVKTIIVNGDDEHAEYFLNFSADKKITFALKSEADITWQNLQTNLLGDYNQCNVLAGVAVAKSLNLKIEKDLTYLKPLPGRLEFIENNLDIKILVDYTFEPKAVEKLYQIADSIEHKRIIHILGSAGGGRDKARRPILGQLASDNADIVIVTNEDPYDEDPQEIIDQVAGTVDKNKLYKILDRREAIRKALSLAQTGDLILVTGKGAEQAICIENNKKIPWDDRKVIKEELEKK